jgi:uncharacterized protein YcfJ
MKRIAIAVASLFTVIGTSAYAAYDRYGNYYEPNDYRSSDFRDAARVIESRPVYAATGSSDECWNMRTRRYEPRPDTSNRVGGGAAIGAVAGGVLGHQVGSGSGNTAATIGGALLGGLIGNKVENDRREDRASADFDMNRCRTVSARNGETLQGYDVRYVYRGQEYTARMASDPGRRLLLGRDIRDDGTPYDVARFNCDTVDPINRPGWCDQEGQGG